MSLDLQRIFDAGRVRRWHSNPDMSWCEDYNDAHQGRVARIILALHPKPRPLLIAAALTHDDGELVAGDIGFDAKAANPGLRQMAQILEDSATCEMWGLPKGQTPYQMLNDEDRAWVKFADQLDSYMWMMHKQPRLQFRNDWDAQKKRLHEFAIQHQIWHKIRLAIGA